jgi:hypothetical protein
MSPNGDLYFVDVAIPSSNDGNPSSISDPSFIVWRQPHVHQIPPLTSLAESRKAHAWTTLPQYNEQPPQMVYQSIGSGSPIGGMIFVQDSITLASSLYVTTFIPRVGVVLLEIPLDEAEENEEETEDDKDEDAATTTSTEENDKKNVSRKLPQPRILMRLQRYLPNAMEPGPFVMTPKQRTIFLGTNEGLAILLPNDKKNAQGDKRDTGTEDYRLAGMIALPIMDRPRITSLTVGDDSYLYVTTESRLWRMKIRDG